MKFLYSLVVIILSTNLIIGQNNRYKGIVNDVSIMNPYWSNYKESIRVKHQEAIDKSIERGIDNYTLIEYCFALNHLLSKIETSPEAQEAWLFYMDSLLLFCQQGDVRSGIVPLEAQVFIATLKRNEQWLRNSYPNAYDFLIQNTPTMTEYGYKPSEYESLLQEKGFSEIKGEGVVFDLLLLEDVYLLNIIENNPNLKKRFITWLTYEVPDRSFAFEYSDDRASEILRRKFLYLYNIFNKQESELAKYTAEQLLKIKVVRPMPIPQDSPLRIINGTWQGAFGDKEIYFLNGYSNVNNDSNKVTGESKFVGQPDSKYVPMVGNYKDKGSYFEIEMIEQPDTAQWNGVFKYKIDKETRVLKGTWESNNGKLKREFELKKVSEDEW